jgi:hypothetical protein
MAMHARKCILPAIAAALLLCGGCVRWRAPVIPPSGLLFTHYRAPLTADNAPFEVGGKTGESSSYYFSLYNLSFAWDDVSIERAAADGGITRVTYADYEVLTVLGVFGELTIRAHGE